MTAYSFKACFVDPIRVGTKQQTIRAHRRGRSRHARPGELVQLYFGMRTRRCAKIIDDVVCTEVVPVTFDLRLEGYPVLTVEGRKLNECERRVFARADGFNHFGEMVAFWLDEHGRDLFEGVCIKWRPA